MKDNTTKQLFVRFYIILVALVFIIFAGVKPLVEKLIGDEILFAHRELGKGVYFLMAEKFEGLNEAEVSEIIERIQPEFGYPLNILQMEEVQVDERFSRDLQEGRIIRDEKKDLHLMRLKNTDLVLVMGPYPLATLINRARWVSFGILTIFLILPAGVWAFLFQKNLRKMESVTQRFVEGDHSARLNPVGFLPLKKITGAFNLMAEQTQRLLESRKELVNSVSHEIRTPLARIKFSLEMLKGSPGEHSRTKDYAGEIGKDVEEISLLVDEMLTYEKFGAKSEVPGRFSEREIVPWLRNITAAENENTPQISISFRASPAFETSAIGHDPLYLGRVVGNLIRNAARHAKSKVEIIFEMQSGTCFIHVDDDGPGIPPESAEKIFEPFFRLDESRQRESGGYGLGLAISKRIVRWHKGSIRLGISPWEGARFTIELPVQE